jgi:hypothetical protein
MSKFLLNLLLQISKALVNSKIQFLIRKFFFLLSARPTPWPAWPLAWPAHRPRRPHRPKSLGRPIQPARRSRLRGKYVFIFGSRLPESVASPSSLCQPGPTYQIHPLPRTGRPRSEIPRAAVPRLGYPRAFTAFPHHSPPLIPFKSSLNTFNGIKAINIGD